MAGIRLRSSSVVAPILALLLLLAACGSPQSTSLSSIGSNGAASTNTPTAAPTFPLTLTDDAGHSVALAAPPTRVVSLAPSNTEVVCALDACGRLVGVTDFDDYPTSVKQLPKVVIQAKVDVEKVVAARPDLVLAAGNGLTPDAVITQLSGLGLKVLTLYPKDLDGVYADIALVGRALGADAAAAQTVSGMRARVTAVTDRLAGATRPRVFYEVGVFEGSIYTAGKDSFLASLISIAGGEPITGDPKSTAIQLENLVAADPQLILLGDASYDPSLATKDKALATVRARAGWEGMSAVKAGAVVPFLQDLVTTRPGPRIVDGLEALARAIHPELFGG
ncbi:MAG TPA: helical backbone metal receptor [Candidatus Limnocylindria bacterium]|nr:helical backbone metal receptor [Candidatus Limnocylindria bacterium]